MLIYDNIINKYEELFNLIFFSFIQLVFVQLVINIISKRE